MKLKLPRKIHPYLILLLAVLAFYWPVAFLSYGLKWDLIDVVLPFRYHFSECIRSGYFPFWNPYQQTGYPFYADLQAPTYYPELLYTSLFTSYGVYVMHFLFILYSYLAAIGMYRLSFYFNKDKAASLIAGMAWAGSGFLIGHGQHFFVLVSACWLPFVLYEFLRMNEEGKAWAALRAGLFTFLLISGGYQAISIGSFYLLLVLFIYFILKDAYSKNWNSAWKRIKLHLAFAITVSLLSLPLIISTLEVMDHVTRLDEGISLESTLRFSQPLTSLISFILPFSTLKYPEFFGGITASMLNHYFGIILLVLLIPAMLRKRKTTEYILLAFGLLIMASAFKPLHIREFMVEYIPLMDMFKYPAILRLFALLAFILIGTNYLAELRERHHSALKPILLAGLSLALVILAVLGYSLYKITSTGGFSQLNSLSFPQILEQLTFHQHIAIQAFIQLIIIGVFIFFILKMKKQGFSARPLILLSFIELFLAAQFNIFFTTASIQDKPYRMEHDLRLYSKHFPIPPNSPVILNDQQHASFKPFWRNTYIFRKQVSFDAFSSFKLKAYDSLDTYHTGLRDKVLENSLIYFSDHVLPMDSLDHQEKTGEIHPSSLFLYSTDYIHLKDFPAKLDSAANINITGFSPNKMEFEVHSPTPIFLTLVQGYYPGWKAYVNNEEVPIITSNFHYQSIALQAGDHEVRFVYERRIILVFYIISNILFLFLALLILGRRIKKSHPGNRCYLYIPIGILGLALGLLSRHLSYQDDDPPIPEYYHQKWKPEKALAIKNVDLIHSEKEFIPLASFSSEEAGRNDASLVVHGSLKSDSWSGAMVVSEIIGPNGKRGWHAEKMDRWLAHPGQWNDFTYFRNLYDLREGEEIKVFLWNKDHHKLQIKGVGLEIYP